MKGRSAAIGVQCDSCVCVFSFDWWLYLQMMVSDCVPSISCSFFPRKAEEASKGHVCVLTEFDASVLCDLFPL